VVTLTVEDTEGLSQSVSKPVRVVKRDVAVLEITKSHVWVYEGRSVSVNVTIANLGECTETVNFTLYYQMSTGKKISAVTKVLQPGENAAFSLTWDTTGLPCSTDNNTYALVAQALPQGIDNDLGNSLLYGGEVEVRIFGDINNDDRVNMLDLWIMSKAFAARSGGPDWNGAADLNLDGWINMLDAYLTATNFGKTS
jgi:hypothetical protein